MSSTQPSRRLMWATVWISSCLLCGAYAAHMPPHFRPVWAAAGAVGIVASVGVAVSQMRRTRKLEETKQIEVQAQVAKRLTKLKSSLDAQPSRADSTQDVDVVPYRRQVTLSGRVRKARIEEKQDRREVG